MHCSSACPSSTPCAPTACRTAGWRSIPAMRRTPQPCLRMATRCRLPSAVSIWSSCRTRSSWRSTRTSTLAEVQRVLMPEGRVVILGFNAASLWGLRQRLGPGTRQVRWHRGVLPAAPGRVHRLLAAARLAAAAELRGRGRTFRRLPPAARIAALAGTLCLDGPRRRPLVAGLRRGLHGGGRQTGSRHAAGRAGRKNERVKPQRRRRRW